MKVCHLAVGSLLLIGVLLVLPLFFSGCISSEYVESPKAPQVKKYEDESTVKQYPSTKELGEAHPFLIVDGKELDYDPELQWFVYPGTKTKAYWLEPAEYVPDRVPSRVLVPTGADGQPAIGPLDANYEVSRVWSESKQIWEKPDGNGGFRPWDPTTDGNAPPPPPPIDDKVTQVDDEENVWHVRQAVLVATRPSSINSVFMNPQPDERRVQAERLAQGKLVWLYPTTQLKYLETAEFNGVPYREFAVVAAVLDAGPDGEPVDLRRVYIPNELLKQPDFFRMGPQEPVTVDAAPADPNNPSPADVKPKIGPQPPPGPPVFEISTPPDVEKQKTEREGVKD